jgi:hypothetical protein
VKFGVITRVPDPTRGGNMALALAYVEVAPGGPPDYMPTLVPAGDVLGPVIIALRMPVFALGEILVCNEDGRELSGNGRKPDKWDVDTEWFTSIDDAAKRAQEVTL